MYTEVGYLLSLSGLQEKRQQALLWLLDLWVIVPTLALLKVIFVAISLPALWSLLGIGKRRKEIIGRVPGCVYYIHFIYKPDFKTVFSPFQSQPILESGAVELLCGLTQSENPALRVNGIWALMVCFTKRRKQLLKLKLKNVLFEMSEIFFFKNLNSFGSIF